jgi:hypothetical protein
VRPTGGPHSDTGWVELAVGGSITVRPSKGNKKDFRFYFNHFQRHKNEIKLETNIYRPPKNMRIF